ncbi:hypothetical protein DV515_00012238 [Chloebia gouldiae]|uniref:Uncharacterized protein n=1 Tax=Chloebia gouldiae TaxID=44316 RepID=A0A3L8S452_CHLGU|nr:hypothetical protein DV515_00012238 [Chloebia gouldiae]
MPKEENRVWCTGKDWFPITRSIPYCGISLDLAPSLPPLPPGFCWSCWVCPSTQVQMDHRKPSCVSHRSHRRPETVQ